MSLRAHTPTGREPVVSMDAVIVGSGVAGLTVALGLAPQRVALLTKTALASGSSTYAQGGVAVAIGQDDSPEIHAADTLRASDGLADPARVLLMTEDGPRNVRRLIELGTQFDRGRDGQLLLGREGAHSRRRVLHAGGDATGAEIVRALVNGVLGARSVAVHESTTAIDLVVRNGRIAGVLADGPTGPTLYLAPAIVVATGGLGRAYLYSTNPPEATGDGHAMAARAGARLVDMEFVQFHPTALDTAATPSRPTADDESTAHGPGPVPLLTEALRGEGAILVDDLAERFMQSVHPLADLAPRDVVARAIWRHQADGRQVFLDARDAVGARFPTRFPTVFETCADHGIDPRTELMPVAPAAHYHMGGIAVDENGRSTTKGLWACGEAAATAVHGANRLASNSLLEALVFGARVAEDIAAQFEMGRLPPSHANIAASSSEPEGGMAPELGSGSPEELPGAPDDTVRTGNGRQPASAGSAIEAVRRTMWENVGLVRNRSSLETALADLERIEAEDALDGFVARNLVAVGRLVATAALARTESRGAHYRSDHPNTQSEWERRIFLACAPNRDEPWIEIVETEPAPSLAGVEAVEH